ncbi:MAG: hypothetical protein KIT09_35720 [Bryobacteraceae bacterium]|nr:hypothetical protein [Bryobacteraceae bacterium]
MKVRRRSSSTRALPPLEDVSPVATGGDRVQCPLGASRATSGFISMLGGALKAFVRHLVVATSFAPLLQFYCGVYHLLVRLVARKFKKFPGTRAVYLSRSVALGRIVPGISDIDFTVIGDWAEDERKSLVAKYARIARLLPLYDPDVSTHSPNQLRLRYATSHYHQFRFTEGRRAWKLLCGRDYLQELLPLPQKQMVGGFLAEIKVWWFHFARCAFGTKRAVRDRIFERSICYKAVAEVLRLDAALRGDDFMISREQAVAGAIRSADMACPFLQKLRDCTTIRYVRYEGDILADTKEFLWCRLEHLLSVAGANPGFLPLLSTEVNVDCTQRESLYWMGEEQFLAELLSSVVTQVGTSCRAVYRLHSITFAMDEIVLGVDVESARALPIGVLCALGELCRQGHYPRMRLSLYILLERAAYQVGASDWHGPWRAVLTPELNPDTFWELDRPETSLRGSVVRNTRAAVWCRLLSQFVKEGLLYSFESLEDGSVFEADELEFLRMFWGCLQLIAVQSSVKSGMVVYPHTPAAVCRTLARCGFEVPAFLAGLEKAYRRILLGASAELEVDVPTAVSYMKKLLCQE